MRNYIITDEREESELKAQIRKEMLQKLASELLTLQFLKVGSRH